MIVKATYVEQAGHPELSGWMINLKIPAHANADEVFTWLNTTVPNTVVKNHQRLYVYHHFSLQTTCDSEAAMIKLKWHHPDLLGDLDYMLGKPYC